MTRTRIPQVDPTAAPSPLERVTRLAVSTRAGTWLGRVLAANVDPWLLKASGGRIDTGIGFPTLNITTTGRKSGLPRTTTLVYFTRGDEVILIASSFGRDRHPAWYLNLKDDPRAVLLRKGFRGNFVAREAGEAERRQLFGLAVELYGGYANYAAATDRRIPVMILTPDCD